MKTRMMKWNLLPPQPERARALSEALGLPLLPARVLAARGITDPAGAEALLSGGEFPESPFEMMDMEKAARRIAQAIGDGERIIVYGDYDADGVSATVALYSYLSLQGGDVGYYIPERDGEGYGLSTAAVRQLADEGCRLIVTVDNGITALKEIEYANSLGLCVVVTDHHQPLEVLPPAYAVVNPHRKDCPSSFKQLCGAGIVLKLICAMEGGDYDSALDFCSDIVTLGTVGDIVPLTGENRIIVSHGLQHIEQTENPGLAALIGVAGLAGKEMTSGRVAFGLVPRINAAGRLGSAELACRLLLCEEEEEAAFLAGEVDRLNTLRRQTETEILTKIRDQMDAAPEMANQPVLMAVGEDWNTGVVGIVASRAVEQTGKPAFLFAPDGEDCLRASGRSVEGFSLFELLCDSRELLVRFGGHEMAAGLTVRREDFPALCQRIYRYCAERFPIMPAPALRVDLLVSPAELTVDEVAALSMLEPFGSGNPAPVFGIKNAVLDHVTSLSEGKHSKLRFRCGNDYIQTLFFGVSPKDLPYQPGDALDIAFTCEINRFNGTESVSCTLKEISPAGFDCDAVWLGASRYDHLLTGRPLSAEDRIALLPNREEFAFLFRYLVKNQGFSGGRQLLWHRVCRELPSFGKLCVILHAFEELGLTCETKQRIDLSPQQQKVRLEDAPIMQLLTQQ